MILSEKKSKRFAFVLVLVLVLLLAALVFGLIQSWADKGELPASPSERIVILIGLDGFRPDYLQKFATPVLNRLAREGTTAERMVSSFPSLTFPNFYTLATGLRPQRHGIINNRMYDPTFNATFALGSPSSKEGRWWGGEPVWLTVQRHGLKSACMFWPGSDADVGGRRPDEWRSYDGKVTAQERVETVLSWLARSKKERPSLITLYFHEADSAGHKFGLETVELQKAVEEVDASIGKLMEGIKKLRLQHVVQLVCVADHGMAEVHPDRTIPLVHMMDLQNVEVDFTGAVAGVRPKTNGETAQQLVERLRKRENHFRVFLKEEMPEHWHFRDNLRIPPVILVADEGWMIVKQPILSNGLRATFLKATHGFDPELHSMSALFIAHGSAFQKGVVLPPFQNVEVYAMICEVLGIKPAENDGRGILAGQVLKL